MKSALARAILVNSAAAAVIDDGFKSDVVRLLVKKPSAIVLARVPVITSKGDTESDSDMWLCSTQRPWPECSLECSGTARQSGSLSPSLRISKNAPLSSCLVGYTHPSLCGGSLPPPSALTERAPHTRGRGLILIRRSGHNGSKYRLEGLPCIFSRTCFVVK